MAKLISGCNSMELADKISALAKISIVNKVVRKFPDGDIYVRLEDSDLKGEKIFIVHSLYPDQNENLMELFFTMDLVKEKGGKPYIIIPYFAYGRQDGVFQPGEAFSLKSVAKILKCLGAEKLITVDAHFQRKTGDFNLFGIPATNISAVTLQIEHAKKVIKGEFVVVGPDDGAKDFLYKIKDTVFLKKEKYCPICKMKATDCKCKTKRKSYEIKIEAPEYLKNKNVLLLDDMITSGGTIIEAAKALKSNKNKVFVGCTHGLFVGDSLERLKKYADYVFCTDTIKSGVSKVSVAGLIADEIKKM